MTHGKGHVHSTVVSSPNGASPKSVSCGNSEGIQNEVKETIGSNSTGEQTQKPFNTIMEPYLFGAILEYIETSNVIYLRLLNRMCGNFINANHWCVNASLSNRWQLGAPEEIAERCKRWFPVLKGFRSLRLSSPVCDRYRTVDFPVEQWAPLIVQNHDTIEHLEIDICAASDGKLTNIMSVVDMDINLVKLKKLRVIVRPLRHGFRPSLNPWFYVLQRIRVPETCTHVNISIYFGDYFAFQDAALACIQLLRKCNGATNVILDFPSYSSTAQSTYEVSQNRLQYLISILKALPGSANELTVTMTPTEAKQACQTLIESRSFPEKPLKKLRLRTDCGYRSQISGVSLSDFRDVKEFMTTTCISIDKVDFIWPTSASADENVQSLLTLKQCADSVHTLSFVFAWSTSREFLATLYERCKTCPDRINLFSTTKFHLFRFKPWVKVHASLFLSFRFANPQRVRQFSIDIDLHEADPSQALIALGKVLNKHKDIRKFKEVIISNDVAKMEAEHFIYVLSRICKGVNFRHQRIVKPICH